MTKLKTDGSARSEALAWYIEQLDGDLSPADRAAFEDWLRADPTNEREYRELDALCDRLGAFETAPEVQMAKSYAEQLRAEAERKRRSLRYRVAAEPWPALAAAGLVAVVAGWMVLGSGLFGTGDTGYRTAVGEQRVVELADGSVMRLNTQSSVEVRYSDDFRRVLLRDGQAGFDVARDPDRPFTVEAGEGVVTALGTQFDVYKSGAKVTVTLLEGIVEVRPQEDAPPSASVDDDERALFAASRPPAPPPAIELRPGEQVSIHRDGALSAVAAVDVDRAAAWRDGKLDFHDTPLDEAIVEVNRYSRSKLVLIDRELAEIRVSGIFNVGRPANFVRALEARFGVRTRHTADDRILLEAPA